MAYALTDIMKPVTETLVAMTNIAAPRRVAPENTCIPTQLPLPTNKPAIGVPMRIPKEAQNVFIPILPPTVLRSLVIDATVVGCRLTKAPERAPYSRAQTIRPPAVCSMAIQQKPSILAHKVQQPSTLRAPTLSAMRPGMIRPAIDPALMMGSM